ncbi:HU family DNA-binding protein [bacterium]|nr:HU family DNA-binding protein [bacterium]
MAKTIKPMTKSELITTLAEKSDLSKKQISAVMDELAQLAYKESKKGFTIPGICKITLQKRKARKGRNPATGEEIKIAAKTVLKIRPVKAIKDAVLPQK